MSIKMTLSKLNKMKQSAKKIVCLTAYDATISNIANQAGVDVILVGDSLGMVVQGHQTTIPVSLDEMIYHTQMVQRKNTSAWCMVDMPFMADADMASALQSAAKLMKSGANMVKLEGGVRIVNMVSELAKLGVPVCSHLGLLPQHVAINGYKVTGRDEASAQRLLEEAKAVEAAGAAMLLLECVPSSLAKQVTDSVSIPVIGIGSGVDTDGQVLVVNDVLGLTENAPRFSKNFLDSTTGSIQSAIQKYTDEVRNSVFPTSEHLID